MVYAALATALVVQPVSTAIAFTVSLEVTEIGVEYRLDAVVGVVPSRL
jgi:hypothetical protein